MMGQAATYNTLITWRIITGIGVGAASMLSPLYIAEISPPAKRGKMVSINQLAIVLGILLAYLSSYLLADTENNWRWMFSSAAVPALIFFICAFYLPESPKWLSQLHNQASAGSIDKVNRWKILSIPGVGAVVFIGVMVAVFQQISGANVVFVYAPIIFEKAGMPVKDQLFQQVLIGLINLAFTLVAIKIVDRIGRRTMMIGGSIGMSIMLCLMAAAFYYNWLEGPWVTIITLVFIAIYATTLAPVTWVLISEIFPNNVRGIAMSIATTLLWVACFAVTYAFPVLISYFSDSVWWTFLIFAAICFIYFLFLLKFIPETKNKSLEQIESDLVPAIVH